MNNYKRIVSYLYYYGNREKKNNVGYVRMERKDRICKVTIHMRSINSNDKKLGVYFFYREKEQLVGISLGTMVIKKGVGEFRKVMEAQVTKDLQVTLEEMGGIILYENNEHFFATQWDDEFIDIMNFYIADKNNENKWDWEHIKESEELKAADLMEVEIQEIEKEEKEQEEKLEENFEMDSREKEEENFMLEKNENKENLRTENEKNEEEISDIKEKEYLKNNLKEQERRQEIESHSRILKINEAIENFSRRTNQKLQNSNIMNNQIERNHTYENVKEDNDNMQYSGMMERGYMDKKSESGWRQQVKNQQRKLERKIELAEKLFQKFPQIEICNQDVFQKCVKIEPQDIGNFPMETWILANNSFLLHGYYQYRYLIFALYFNEKQWEYVIGVPGIYEPKEQFMAEMFGFGKFCPTNQKDTKMGTFGYWYQAIHL